MGAWVHHITCWDCYSGPQDGTEVLLPANDLSSPIFLEAVLPETYCVAQAGLTLTAIFLPQIPSLKHVSKDLRGSQA